MGSQTQPLKFPFCQLNGIRVLIFDWDGVLLNSADAYYRAYEMAFREVGVSTTPREIYLLEGRPTGQLITALFAKRGIQADETTIQAMVERRREYQSSIGARLFPSVWRLLNDLRTAGYRLAIVTGSSCKSVELALTKEQENFFDAVITANDVKRPKPAPEPFLLAAELLRVPSSECLVVENAPFGIEAAHRAGCCMIGICTTLPPEDLQQADWVVENHAALELLLVSQEPVMWP